MQLDVAQHYCASWQADYYLGFFFWLDVISTATLLQLSQPVALHGRPFSRGVISRIGLAARPRLDLTWVSEAIQASGFGEKLFVDMSWLGRLHNQQPSVARAVCMPSWCRKGVSDVICFHKQRCLQ